MTTPPTDISRDRLRRGIPPAPASPQREAALGAIPAVGWLMTAAHGEERVGVPVRWVQRAGGEPALVSVAMPKGSVIAMTIRDSRAFALNLLPGDGAEIERRFQNGMAERLGDPFRTLRVERMTTGAPCLSDAVAVLDCELFRRLDLEMDCEMYVGLVLAARGRV